MTTDTWSIRQRSFARHLLLENRKQTALTHFLAQYKANKGQKAVDELQNFIDKEIKNFGFWCMYRGCEINWRSYCYYYAQTMPVKEALQ